MIYKIEWPGKPRQMPSTVIATRNCKVVEAPYAMTWSLGRDIGVIKSTLEKQGAEVTAVSIYCSLENYNAKHNA